MRWIKMSEKLPEYGKKVFVRMQDAMWVGLLFKDSDDGFKGNILTLRGALEDVTGERIDHYKWLDEELPASIEDEAEKLYPYADKNVTLSTVTYNSIMDVQRETHITAARHYIGEIEKLRAENSKMAEAVEILTELCAIKKYKDSVGKDSHYEQEQPKAWKRANEFLNRIATSALK